MSEIAVTVEVVENLCAGSGLCVRERPDVFAIDDFGIARVSEPTRVFDRAELDDVAVLCPAGAIKLHLVEGR